MSGTYLLVGLGEERHALAIEDVVEVGAAPASTPLPGAPHGVVGLQKIRGEVVPLLDVAALVGAGPSDGADAMVVVEHGGRRAALAVDALLDVTVLEEGAGRTEAAPLLSSVLLDGALVGVLDTRGLLDALEGTGRP